MSGLTYEELRNLNPCPESMIRVTKLMGGAEKWNGRKISAYEARAAGATFSDIVWAASAVAQNDKDVERRMRLWLADCAARVLPIFEKECPDDARPRQAIIAARRFARGETDAAARAAARDAALNAAWAAARDAARDAARAAARDAARDAARAAARDAARAAARAAARDAARAAARDAARDAAWAAARDAARDAAWADEERWQFDRLIARLESEPDDWPLSALAKETA
jgi:hypothetical protein